MPCFENIVTNTPSYWDIGLSIGTIIIAVVAIFVSLSSLYLNRISKRAYLVPIDFPGEIKLQQENMTRTSGMLTITLENYGVNPAKDTEVEIYTFNDADMDGSNQEARPVLAFQDYCLNPIPKGGKYFIRFETGTIGAIASHFVFVKVKYYDIILKNCYKDVFIWKTNNDGELVEVNPSEAERVKTLVEE